MLLFAPIWPRCFLFTLSILRLLGALPNRVKGSWPPQRILIVNLTNNLGDALMMLPLLDALHDVIGDATIDLITESPMDVPLRVIPFLRHVHAFNPGRKIPFIGYYQVLYRMFVFTRQNLKDEPYDLALLPRWGTDPALSSYLAAITTAARRCGHDPAEEKTAQTIFPGMALLFTDISRGGEGLAEGVREELLLVACGLKKNINTGLEESSVVRSVVEMGRKVDFADCMRRLDLSIHRPYILLAPGASHPVRCWPVERFAALGIALSQDSDMDIYSVGGPADHALSKRIEDISGGLIRNLAGRTSILEVIALTQRARLLITNDSGPAHVGGSVGTPTLVLSMCPTTAIQEHGNSPLRVRPVGPHVLTLQPDRPAPGCGDRCAEATAHCILGLSVDSVFSAARGLLRERS